MVFYKVSFIFFLNAQKGDNLIPKCVFSFKVANDILYYLSLEHAVIHFLYISIFLSSKPLKGWVSSKLSIKISLLWRIQKDPHREMGPCIYLFSIEHISDLLLSTFFMQAIT